MDLTLVLMLGTVAAGILFGIMVGILMSRSDADAKVEKAFRRGKEEADVERANLAVSLGEQLVKIREGLHQVAQAYEGTVRVVQENLIGKLDPSQVSLVAPSEQQLALDFHGRTPEERAPAASLRVEESVEEPVEMKVVEESLYEAERTDEQSVEESDLPPQPPTLAEKAQLRAETKILLTEEDERRELEKGLEKGKELNGRDKNVTLQ